MQAEIDNLTRELNTEKLLIRQKAFAKLSDILNGRLKELQRVIDADEDITWQFLFSEAHKGVKLQSQKLLSTDSELLENDPKITTYSKVLLKLCDSPGKSSEGIPCSFLMSKVTEMLSEPAGLKYFGKCYLQVLQKAVLKPNNNLTDIQLETWKDLVRLLFFLLKSKRHKIPFLEIVYSTKLAVEFGCFFSHLASDLHLYLKPLTSLLEKRTEDREKLELLIVAYHCCRNIAVDYRFKVAQFTEIIAKHIHLAYKVDMVEEKKEILYRLMDLALIVHYPSTSSDRNKLDYINNKVLWYQQLRNFIYIMQLELKPPQKAAYRNATKLEINQLFAQFAARLCFLVYWDETILNDNVEDESAPKRLKRSNQLQSMIEFTSPSQDIADFNWKWLHVISETIYNYPAALQVDEFQPLLQLLSKCQATIEHDIQVYTFAKCCFVLLHREESFPTNPIIANLCTELWHKIAEGAARVCTSNNKLSVENHALLQILIHHHKHPSNSFIEDVIKIFLSKAAIKSDDTLQTLVTILTRFNLDSLQNGRELNLKILQYILEKETLTKSNLKQIIKTTGKEKPSVKMLAQIGVMTCLTKTDILNYSKNNQIEGDKFFESKWKLQHQRDYKDEMREIVQLILKKCNKSLLIEDEDFGASNKTEISDKKMAEFPAEIKCIIHPLPLYDIEFSRIIEFKSKIVNADDNVDIVKEYLHRVLENNELMMCLSHSFLAFEAYNEEKFNSSFINKKIDYHMQEINMLFGLLMAKTKELSLQDVNRLLVQVKSLFSSNYHEKLCKRIRSFELENCIKWVSVQVNHDFISQDDDTEVMSIDLDKFSKAKMEEKLKFLTVETLCFYNNFEGLNTNLMVKCLEQIDLDPDDNMDLHTVFHVLKLLGNQKHVPVEVIRWIWSHIIPICQIYHNHQYVSCRMINLLRAVMHLSKDHEREMADNVIALFSSFGQVCATPTYNPSIAVQFLAQFKHFHEIYFDRFIDDEKTKKVYSYVYETFLNSSQFSVKMAAIKTISCILHSDIELENLPSKRANQKQIAMEILEKNSIKYVADQMETDEQNDDENATIIASFFQLYSSLFCVSFLLRKPIILQMSKLVLQYKLSDETASSVFNKILSFLNCKADSLMDSNSIVDLSSKWIKLGYSMNKFPWYFCGCKSLGSFFQENYEHISLAFLKNNCRLIEEFAKTSDFTAKQNIEPILPNCFSFMLPIQAGCKDVKYEDKAFEMKTKIDTYFTTNEQATVILFKISFVIGNLLENLYDMRKFKDICGFDFEIHASDEIISLESFDKCLLLLKQNYKLKADQSILTFFCTQQDRGHWIEKLLMMQKQKVQSTSLKEHKLLYLLQYCVLVEKLLDYLKNPSVPSKTSIKAFLVREITTFLCFLLLDVNYGTKLRETSANFLSSFLTEIIKICAEDVKPFLNKIVSALVVICKNTQGSKKSDLENKCFGIIQFLIVDQKPLLESEIGNLDAFPSSPHFDELRRTHLAIKYKNGDFSLAQEIEHFLKVKTRKVEGLIALNEKLSLKKNELGDLFEKLGSSLGFSEDGETSLLHKLIRALVEYSRQTYEDEERAVEAIKCMGEIGNNDLTTMVFITEDQLNSTTYRKIDDVLQCQKMICAMALDQMESMILHPNPTIFQAASQASYHMMETASSENYTPSVYLRPFNTNAIGSKMLFYEIPKKSRILNLVKVLQEAEYVTYKTWIKLLAVEMLTFVGDKVLVRVARTQKNFAELMCSLMMQLLLIYNEEIVNSSLINGINHFFSESSEKLNYPKVNEGSIFLNKQAIRQMLKLVECIRMHCLDHPKSNIAKDLKLDFLHIAKSARHCEAFFTAVLYCEKWAEEKLRTDSVAFATSRNHKTLQEVMYESYKAIGVFDATELFVSPITKRSLYLQVCDENWQNILEHDAAAQSEDYITLLSDMGLHFLAQKLSSNDQKMKSKNYECLWRLANWDVLIDGDSETKDLNVDFKEEFEKYHFSALKCLKSEDELGQKTSVFKARKAVLHMIQQESLECTQNLYKFLGMSHMLQQIEDFAEVRFHRQSESEQKLLQKWNAQNLLPHDFKLIEPILSQRNSILDTANIRSGKRTWVPAALQENMLHIVKESIEAGCQSDAIKTIAKMKSLTNLSATHKAEVLIQEARLNFKTNMNLSKFCLKRVIDEKEFDREFMLRSAAYRLYGEIQAESFADDVQSIFDQYFKKATGCLEKYAKQHNKAHLAADLNTQELLQCASEPLSQSNESDDEITTKIKSNACVYNTIAKYYDREYIAKCEYIDSPDFKKKREAVENNQKKLIAFKGHSSIDEKRSAITIKKMLEIDEAEIKNVEKQMKSLAGSAVYFYMRSALNDSGDDVLSVFRIISIWLANFKSATLKKVLKPGLPIIPSYKFIVALPQLSVRLSDQHDDGNTLLKSLLERCAIEHPHHTLPSILALVNSYADSDHRIEQEEPRVLGAKKLWNSFKKNPRISSAILQELEDMSNALIHLANADCDNIPKNHKLLKLRDLQNVQCPTLELPLMKDCNYEGIVKSVVCWLPKMDKVGGVNAPKKVFCQTSDGITRPQLLKGKDDLRQDAIMQQVFGVVNQLLKNNKETRKRHARVRTYKVLPLARRSGILEWCKATIPIGVFLREAHPRYHPKDLTPNECQMKIKSYDKEDEGIKKQQFLQICEKFQPVFHHFFYENFKNPGQLFERRLAYTSSVAVSSMVGYILGIGDRHVSNILIDTHTAEVIHIDFGIAFEQGKVLPHKELIPFRLTRDMTAPMGVCGVDGVFRKSCEKTMEILRANDKTLITILEVLLYDPLFSWSILSSKARRRQLDDIDGNNSNEATNQVEKDSMASRALLRIQAKLKGQADDSSGYSSVEGQVECLIQKAINPALLSQLFCGWQAHL